MEMSIRSLINRLNIDGSKSIDPLTLYSSYRGVVYNLLPPAGISTSLNCVNLKLGLVVA